MSLCSELLIIFLTSNTRFQDSSTKDNSPSVSSDGCIGVSTGNWGCGAFGGNPEIKSIIQWLAASQVQEKCCYTVELEGLGVHMNYFCFQSIVCTDKFNY